MMGERERFIEWYEDEYGVEWEEHEPSDLLMLAAWQARARIAAEEKAELVEALRQAVEAIQAFNDIRIDAPGYAKRHRDAIMRYVPEAAEWEALLAKQAERT